MEGTLSREEREEAIGVARIRSFQSYLHFLKEFVSELRESETLVIRPHPSEKPGAWQSLFRDEPRVKVVLDGDITPWIMAEKGTLQFGSSTAVQSAYFGKTNVQLEPEPFPGITDKAPFDFALPVKNSSEALRLLRNAPEVDKTFKRKATGWLETNIDFSEEHSALSKMLIALKAESQPAIKSPRLSQGDKLYLSLLWQGSRVKYFLKRLKVMDDYYRTTYQKIPRGIVSSEVATTILKFSSIEKSDARFSIVDFAKSLVEIESF